jgi:hypothetical protein
MKVQSNGFRGNESRPNTIINYLIMLITVVLSSKLNLKGKKKRKKEKKKERTVVKDSSGVMRRKQNSHSK